MVMSGARSMLCEVVLASVNDPHEETYRQMQQRGLLPSQYAALKDADAIGDFLANLSIGPRKYPLLVEFAVVPEVVSRGLQADVGYSGIKKREWVIRGMTEAGLQLYCAWEDGDYIAFVPWWNIIFVGWGEFEDSPPS